ncbi:unnamed protein product [Ambrosiozyma monospora]|uniref:Unnamed protein product n=1 Tax=Ambrosiozyma monospora TaxID=43982 RepID=A0ACB5SXW8_AMBMO|nr:unnamed protein product [Ambrosiozyma monospora]
MLTISPADIKLSLNRKKSNLSPSSSSVSSPNTRSRSGTKQRHRSKSKLKANAKPAPTTVRDKMKNYTSVLLIIFEQFVTFITLLLPEYIINFFTRLVKSIFRLFKSSDSLYNRILAESDRTADDTSHDHDFNKTELETIYRRLISLRDAPDLQAICQLNGFKLESLLVRTRDGYLLTVHRLNPGANGFTPNGKIVYFQHGLLMSSEIWCLRFNREFNLPFVLCQLGYDVYLGNNRGNKYSSKHVSYNPTEDRFWDFSIDQFSLFDIPDCIDYILELNHADSLTYIGFSQGCSQVLSSISINPSLNTKIAKLILIAPATTPKKLSNWLLNSMVNFKPHLLFLLFGRKIIMPSILFWQRITYPPFFVKLIDLPNEILFDWKSTNIDYMQKFISYFHLYSTTSVKCVVHWFQIIKSARFQMYQDSDIFRAFEYPTESITVPKVLIIYGMADSLVDINDLMKQLPVAKFSKLNKIEMADLDMVAENAAMESDAASIDSSSKSKDSHGLIVRELELSDDDDADYDDNDNDGVISLQDDDKEDNVKVMVIDQSVMNIVGVENYEHLDLIWGRHINHYVINNVLDFLDCGELKL